MPEVLSVCSLQFKAVTDGLKAHAVACSDGNMGGVLPPSIVIEDDRVRLDPGCGVFITMNPGYLGRSELPEGLKVSCWPRSCYLSSTIFRKGCKNDFLVKAPCASRSCNCEMGCSTHSWQTRHRRLLVCICMIKVLFRPITVMVPDLVLICENMLMAEGFVQAKTLASKFHGLYSLLQELLSKQVTFKAAVQTRYICSYSKPSYPQNARSFMQEKVNA